MKVNVFQIYVIEILARLKYRREWEERKERKKKIESLQRKEKGGNGTRQKTREGER